LEVEFDGGQGGFAGVEGELVAWGAEAQGVDQEADLLGGAVRKDIPFTDYFSLRGDGPILPGLPAVRGEKTPEEVAELLQSFTGAPRSRCRVIEGAADFDYAELADAHWDAGDTEAIAALLSNAPVAIDELIRQSGMDTAGVHMALLELELAGELERHEGGLVRRAG
jgi:hypothetical protein